MSSNTPDASLHASETSVPQAHAGMSWLYIAALFLIGFNLRSVLLEVPPILPFIQSDLGLNYTETGLINSLPMLIFGVMAIPVSLFSNRFGATTTMTIAIVGLGLASFARSLSPNLAALFLSTALVSFSITIGQTMMPLFVHRWFAHRLGQVTAIYSTGLMAGEIAGAALTFPWLYSTLARHQWRLTFVYWSLPVAVVFLLWLLTVRRERTSHQATLTPMPQNIERTHHASFPIKRTIQAGLLLGSGSAMFFLMSTWIPVYFHYLHRNDGAQALSVLTISQLVASIGLMAAGERFTGKRSGFLIIGTLAFIASILWFILPLNWSFLLIGVYGFSSLSLAVILGQKRR